jgi:two-component system chemotaxis sensor kinase CheA
VNEVRPILQLAELLAEQRDPMRIRSLSEEVRTLLGQLDRRMSSGIDQLERELQRELQQVREGAEKLRLVPVESLLAALQRMARDSALQVGKSVVLAGQGGSVRLDANILATAQGALLQVVRNAVAHGIESKEQRLAAGKPAEGRIDVVVTRQAGRVTFEVTDDGRGLDLDALRAAAQRQGIPRSRTGQLEAEELVTRLLRGGLTTSTSVNLVSGRGVGLDVVREATERLGGEVSIRSVPGRSTTVVLRVPITLASLRALQVQAGEESALLPLECVRHALHLKEAQVAHTSERETLVYEGQVLPFLPLSRALGHPAPSDLATGIVIRAAGGLLALGVSSLAGITSALVRPLPELAPASPVVAGAALDAAGDPQLVLDPDGLLEFAAASTAPPPEQRLVQGTILVIDDSLTTRQLEQSILESAGFDVELAASAEEGLELARKRRYSLFLVDVEMPGMDGFTFIEHVRRDPDLSSIPCILVTSRNSPEDLKRGVEVGARGHIIKSEFNQKELLDRIGNLLA